MAEVAENLLGSIPTGEILIDPKEGDHDARLGAVELVEQGNGHSVKLTWMDMTDSNGRPFEHQERITVPTSGSQDFIHRMFLAACHDFEVVPRNARSRILADTETDRDAIVQAFSSKIGTVYPISIKSDNKGYLRSRISRKKKS